jgi:alkylation response protein AidB-like acyl-CoA dehydrogenase
VKSVTYPEPGDWSALRALAAKEFATTTAREVVETAVQVVGAASVSKRHELERLFDDRRAVGVAEPGPRYTCR